MDTSNVREDGWEQELIEYSLGVMEPGDAAAFKVKLNECRQHVLLARQYEQSVAWLGAAAQAAEPPQGHKSRLMSRIAATPQEVGIAASTQAASVTPETSPTTARPSLQVVPPIAESPSQGSGAPVVNLDEYREGRRNTLIASIGAVAAALILVIGIWTFLGRNNIIPEGYQVAQLAPQPEYPGVSALVLYHPDKTDAVLLADGLPTLPTDKVYELWVLPKEGNPINAGVFTPESDGSGKHQTTTAETVGSYNGFAVTIEDGPLGKDAPEGSMVAAGTLATP
jgi:anti-sigma-K factor RskA